MAEREVINLEHSDEDEPVATPTKDVIAIDDDSQLEDSPGVEIIDVDAPTPPSPRGQKRKKDDKAAPAMRWGARRCLLERRRPDLRSKRRAGDERRPIVIDASADAINSFRASLIKGDALGVARRC